MLQMRGSTSQLSEPGRARSFLDFGVERGPLTGRRVLMKPSRASEAQHRKEAASCTVHGGVLHVVAVVNNSPRKCPQIVSQKVILGKDEVEEVRT